MSKPINLLTAYYYYSWECLKDYFEVQEKPEFQITTAKKYMGQIVRYNTGKVIIKISKFNHIYTKWLLDPEDEEEIINTICHELAHLFYFDCDIEDHGKEHTELTESFTKIVLGSIKIMRYDIQEKKRKTA